MYSLQPFNQEDDNFFFNDVIILEEPWWDGKKEPTTGEVALWRAVIVQALRDISDDNNRIKYQALSWFASLDFITVCENAYVEPECVRAVLREKLKTIRKKKLKLKKILKRKKTEIIVKSKRIKSVMRG
jgi:hypothetical protein